MIAIEPQLSRTLRMLCVLTGRIAPLNPQHTESKRGSETDLIEDERGTPRTEDEGGKQGECDQLVVNFNQHVVDAIRAYCRFPYPKITL